MKILVIHGPNLNMLGIRAPEYYGTDTLDAVNKYIQAQVKNAELDFFQSNHEGAIIDQIQSAHKKYQGIVLNAGALTHYSYAVRDAIEATPLPVVEVHLSNIYARERFRNQSVIAPVCLGSISGFGKMSYVLAVQALLNRSAGKTNA